MMMSAKTTLDMFGQCELSLFSMLQIYIVRWKRARRVTMGFEDVEPQET